MTSGARHLVLVGMMGSGKSTVGRILAERLGRPLVDTDAAVEARTGRSVREIFEADGEAAFRSVESAVLRDAIESPSPSVIATGGGVVLDPANRALLRQEGVRVAWLHADPGVLVARISSGGHRPLLDADPDSALRAIAEAREPLYREVSRVSVAVDARTPSEVAEAVLR